MDAVDTFMQLLSCAGKSSASRLGLVENWHLVETWLKDVDGPENSTFFVRLLSGLFTSVLAQCRSDGRFPPPAAGRLPTLSGFIRHTQPSLHISLVVLLSFSDSFITAEGSHADTSIRAI